MVVEKINPHLAVHHHGRLLGLREEEIWPAKPRRDAVGAGPFRGLPERQDLGGRVLRVGPLELGRLRAEEEQARSPIGPARVRGKAAVRPSCGERVSSVVLRRRFFKEDRPYGSRVIGPRLADRLAIRRDRTRDGLTRNSDAVVGGQSDAADGPLEGPLPAVDETRLIRLRAPAGGMAGGGRTGAACGYAGAGGRAGIGGGPGMLGTGIWPGCVIPGVVGPGCGGLTRGEPGRVGTMAGGIEVPGSPSPGRIEPGTGTSGATGRPSGGHSSSTGGRVERIGP